MANVDVKNIYQEVAVAIVKQFRAVNSDISILSDDELFTETEQWIETMISTVMDDYQSEEEYMVEALVRLALNLLDKSKLVPLIRDSINKHFDDAGNEISVCGICGSETDDYCRECRKDICSEHIIYPSDNPDAESAVCVECIKGE